jgi:hypothetical protein
MEAQYKYGDIPQLKENRKVTQVLDYERGFS